jgi:hypothetical protein
MIGAFIAFIQNCMHIDKVRGLLFALSATSAKKRLTAACSSSCSSKRPPSP